MVVFYREEALVAVKNDDGLWFYGFFDGVVCNVWCLVKNRYGKRFVWLFFTMIKRLLR